MVPVLVGQDVGLRERAALGPELRAQLVEEPEVDVDVLVGRAVERTAGGRRDAATAADLVGEEARPGRDVLLARSGERVGPVGLDAVDVADDPAILAGVRVGTGLALGRQGAAGGPRLFCAAADRLADEATDRLAGLGAAAQEHPYEGDDDPDPAASADHHAAPADPRPADVLDLRWIELRARVERHLRSLPRVTRSRRVGTPPGRLPPDHGLDDPDVTD